MDRVSLITDVVFAMAACYTVSIDVIMVCVSIFGHVCNGPRKLRRYIFWTIFVKVLKWFNHVSGITTHIHFLSYRT